jgi:hypothetical protein
MMLNYEAVLPLRVIYKFLIIRFAMYTGVHRTAENGVKQGYVRRQRELNENVR